MSNHVRLATIFVLCPLLAFAGAHGGDAKGATDVPEKAAARGGSVCHVSREGSGAGLGGHLQPFHNVADFKDNVEKGLLALHHTSWTIRRR